MSEIMLNWNHESLGTSHLVEWPAPTSLWLSFYYYSYNNFWEIMEKCFLVKTLLKPTSSAGNKLGKVQESDVS